MPSKLISLSALPNFEVEVHPKGDEFVTNDILNNGIWEPFETEVVRRCLTSESDFYDVGANIGWYSLVCGLELAKHGGTVHAFEPAFENVSILTRNIMNAQLSNVRINPCALGEEIGPIEMHLSATNKGDHRAYACEPGRLIEKSSVTRFDAYYVKSNRIPFMKIDTQGYELSVLSGMGEYLFSVDNIIILLEFWPHGLGIHTDGVAKLIHLLNAAKFIPYTVSEGDPFVRATSWERLYTASRSTLAPETGYFVNLLLFREGDGARFRLADLMRDEPSHFVPAI